MRHESQGTDGDKLFTDPAGGTARIALRMPEMQPVPLPGRSVLFNASNSPKTGRTDCPPCFPEELWLAHDVHLAYPLE